MAEVPDGLDLAPRREKVFCELIVKESSIGSKGVFAGEPLSKGRVIARDGGVVVPSSFKDFPRYGYAVLIEENLFLSPRNYDDMAPISFMNHSCDANVARIGGMVYVAKREISRGEELTIDYAPLVSGFNDEWFLDCQCGSDRCRKRITANDWRDPALAKALWDEWLPFIQKKIEGAGR